MENISQTGNPLKIGYMHIIKSGGSALNQQLCSLLGLPPLHLEKRADAPNHKDRPYLCGHLLYSDFKKLDCSYIFTVLRDPKARFFSTYTYHLTNLQRQGVASIDHPTFADFVRKINSQKITRRIIGDIVDKETMNRLIKDAKPDRPNKQLYRLIEQALQRFDHIYSGSNQIVLDTLSTLGFIPKTEEIRNNESNESIRIKIGFSEKDFIERMNACIWLDNHLFTHAKQLYPETMKGIISTDEDFLNRLKARFDLTFQT